MATAIKLNGLLDPIYGEQIKGIGISDSSIVILNVSGRRFYGSKFKSVAGVRVLQNKLRERIAKIEAAAAGSANPSEVKQINLAVEMYRRWIVICERIYLPITEQMNPPRALSLKADNPTQRSNESLEIETRSDETPQLNLF